MSLEKFEHYNLSKESLRRIAQANTILEEYRGYQVTLRQLYYQFVQRNFIPNKQSEYKRLGELMSKARLAGLVDWSALEDRSRTLITSGSGYEDIEDYVSGIAGGYYEDLWKTQSVYIEVWVEKEALIGIVQRPAEAYRCPHFACKGYVSQSEQYKAGKRFARKISEGVTPIVLHLGDHDPSGRHMTDDNSGRLEMFARMGVEVRRLALNMDQIEELRPPPNPAKETDNRHGAYREYMRGHGYTGRSVPSWELDALPPDYIDRLIRGAIRELVDEAAMQEILDRETDIQSRLSEVADNWDDVVEWLQNRDL